MKVEFIGKTLPEEGVVVLGFGADRELLPTAKEVDQKVSSLLSTVLANKEKENNGPILVTLPKGLGQVTHALLIKKCETSCDFTELGGKIAALANGLKKDTVTFLLDDILENPKSAADIAFGYKLRSWRFDKYITKKERKQHVPSSLFIESSDPKSSEAYFSELDHIYEGVVLARDVTSEPGNVIYPDSLARRAKELSSDGVKVEIFEPKHLKSMGFNAMLGVAQGSVNEARLVVLMWNGGAKDEAPLAVVGKGVTFDSGGISIKPSNKMEEMKGDMAGSGTVLGLMKAIAKNKLKANVVGIMGLVENMPSGSAQRPGDIVTSLSGQTIEVINTDAEGRLVLADALWYTQDRFKPKYMVDLATLTGAIVVALGYRYAGLFGNNDTLIQQLKEASAKTKERLWQLPLDKELAKALKSEEADYRNSDYNVGAGSIMAAQFLECFVNNMPWAHLDIAGTEWSSKPGEVCDRGATGFGVRLLYQWIKDQITA